MPKTINPKAIFFDLDGTLCDHLTSVKRAGAAVLPLILARYPNFDTSRFESDRSRVFETARALGGAAAMQIGRNEFWRRSLAYQNITDMEFILALAEEYDRVRFANLLLYPESRGVLQALQGRYTLGMITNGPGGLQRREIEVLEIAGFFPAETIIVAGEVDLMKPNPLIFVLAQARANMVGPHCEPRDMLFVGDNKAHDVEAARAAGWQAIWINRFRSEGRPPSTQLAGEIHNLEGLFDYIRK